MLKINGVLVSISENEEEFFILEELLKAETGIRLTHKQAISRDWTHTTRRPSGR